MNIGNKIKELRTINKMTQTDLANAIFLSQDTISLWERGKSKPSIDDLLLLAKLFNVSCDYLLGLED